MQDPQSTSPVYSDISGEIYDLIYADKDYAAESARIIEIINQYGESSGNDMLDVACGTCKHLKYLESAFTVDGVDLSERQVQAARGQFPNNRIEVGDMINFDMNKTYNAIICLFSSIGYVKTKENLNKSIANMARHMKPGGILLIEPWLKPEEVREGSILCKTYIKDNLHVQRMGSIKKDDIVTTSEIHYLIARTGSTVNHLVEVHQLAMFSDDDFKEAFMQAGLTMHIDPTGLERMLYVGKKLSLEDV